MGKALARSMLVAEQPCGLIRRKMVTFDCRIVAIKAEWGFAPPASFVLENWQDGEGESPSYEIEHEASDLRGWRHRARLERTSNVGGVQ